MLEEAPARDEEEDEQGSGASPEAVLPSALPMPAAAAIVFVAAGAVLMMEILAVRLLAPYVGLTLEATTAIIGAALAGIAAGAAIGGYMADRTNTRLFVVFLLIGGGLLALLTVPAVRWLGPGARGEGELAALGITLVALVPSALVLSAVSPAVAHIQLHDLRASGTTVGRLSAWATAGALVGTFGTGFVLVPLMPVSDAVLAIGITLVLAGVLLGVAFRMLAPLAVAGALLLLVALGGWASTIDSPCELETKYHCVYVEPDPERPGGFELRLDDGFHSYVDVNDPTYIAYPYTRWITAGIDEIYPGKKPLDVTFVGGGGFTLPLWLLATRPGSRAEVLELDGEMVDFVEDRFRFSSQPDLDITIGDGRLTLLDQPADSADVVVGDAYSSNTIPWHLATSEWLDEVKRVLKPDGVYVQNILDFPPLELARAEAATALDSFTDVRFVSFREKGGEGLFGASLALFAADRPLGNIANLKSGISGTYKSTELEQTEYDKPEVEAFVDGMDPLRDDFAPADQLVTPE